ncbi:hypothetical protein Gotri_025177 [Gossypium trilobum]|uniref:Leucine-rich repeat-containing N-terminal plant-type domain-containing protein n=1 Tax=Gossypium trilobum TaxID=34281 RepID=A0A7J9FJF3_9ROSI|nr:hypothetical protein [Gossypium trilobum]
MAIIIILLLIILAKAEVNLSNEMSSNTACPENEKQALLNFKKGLIDAANRLASWDPHHHPDCCRWIGVVCDKRTAHVLSLNLSLPPWDEHTDFKSYRMSKLGGKINPCLSKLKHLRYLDLSNNAFEGLLPYQLGNLSNLVSLKLGAYPFPFGLLYVENLQWLSGLSLLKHLDLSWVNLSRASNWLQLINTILPSLDELHLSACQLLPGPSLLNVNLSSLAILDLSFNHFTNQMDVGWVSNLKSLVFLDLVGNDFHGPIPDFLRNMTSLTHLDLSSNYLNSSIPDWLYSFRSLQVLRLPSNQLHGDISSAIGNLTSLNELDLSRNELQGKLPRAMGKLCKLRSINLSGMRLNQDISRILEILSGCSSPRLESLDLASCQLSGQLSDQVGHFKNLTTLYLSNNSISGPIPIPFWQLKNLKELFLDDNSISGPISISLGQLANLEWLYIFNNLLEGVVSEKHFANHAKLKYFYGSGNSLVLRANPNWVPPFQILDLDLGSWQIGPSFPLWLRSQKHLEYLDISNSRISDVIPRWFWGLSTQFRHVNLSRNQISGQIPYLPKGPNIFTFVDLSFNNFSGPLPQISMGSNQYMIDLSNNYFSGSLFHFLCYQLNGTITTSFLGIANNLLSGEIPDCWIKWQSLQVLRLDGNRFTGKIPSSMGTLSELQSLNLHNNKLHGEIPLSLKNCTNLLAINLGKNELDGNIPRWLGQDLSNLIILILRSNKFGGNIPDHLCALSSLQILDLAENNLFGSMPRCMSNFSAMVRGNGSRDNIIEYRGLNGPSTLESASIVTKDQLLVYDKTLNLVRLVDFSCNNLSGEIPKEVTSLQGLQTLNLSRNHLTGKIPESIGSMKSLESLDLSQNQLSSSIPESMSSMTFLSHLNLSFNKLTGIIPTSSQLQGFNESCYAGNHLCGSPLKGCRGSGKELDVRNEAKEISKGQEINWFYISMPLGFVTGFWCVLGPLVISKRWRILYFRFLEAMWWKVCDFAGKF